MTRREKLLRRLRSHPKDYSFEDAEALMRLCGFAESSLGRTSGSRIGFERSGRRVVLHKPHGRKSLLSYQVDELVKVLEDEQ